MEIERKFRIRRLPERLEQYEAWELEQGYLCEKGCTLRVRRTNQRYCLTLKIRQEKPGASALVNVEEEYPIPREAYEHLIAKADGNRICKTRYRIPLPDGLTAELDWFHGKLEGLRFVEVEFPDLEASERFTPPEWFGEEVTFDPAYRNSRLIFLEEMLAD